MLTYVMKMAGACEIIRLRDMEDVFNKKHTYMLGNRGNKTLNMVVMVFIYRIFYMNKKQMRFTFKSCARVRSDISIYRLPLSVH